MKMRHTLISSLTVVALLAPSAAVADDVHITIGLKHVQRTSGQKLKVSGYLHPISGSCTDNRHVAIQRKSGSKWKAIAHATTNGDGRYSKVVGDKTGSYRVVAPASGGCEKDKSTAKGHSH